MFSAIPVPLRLHMKRRAPALQLVLLISHVTVTACLPLSSSALMRKEQLERETTYHAKALPAALEMDSKLKVLHELEGSPLPPSESSQLQDIYAGHLYDTFWEARVRGNAEASALRDAELRAAGEDKTNAIYGELKPETFEAILTHVGARPGMRFFDLGSGTGKLVITAWLHGLNATGVELMRPRWLASCGHLRRAGRKKEANAVMSGPSRDNLRFVHGSFLNYDFSDADIVFTDSVMFSSQMMLSLAKTAERMKPGAMIISARQLPGKSFRVVKIRVPASWTDHQPFFIHIVENSKTSVVPEPMSLRQLPESSNTSFTLLETCSLTDELAISPLLPSELSQLQDIYAGQLYNPFWEERQEGDVEPAEGAGEPAKAFVYGELKPETLKSILMKVGARPGMRFYDLGSGTGKLVITAWLQGLNATGVELLRPRWLASCEHMRRARRGKEANAGTPSSGSLRFMHGSFLEYDFSDADIVFTDSVLFDRNMMSGLAETARRMKPGAMIISARQLPGESFRVVERIRGPASWTDEQHWVIQKVIQTDEHKNGSVVPEPMNLQRSSASNTSATPLETCPEVAEGFLQMSAERVLPWVSTGMKQCMHLLGFYCPLRLLL